MRRCLFVPGLCTTRQQFMHLTTSHGKGHGLKMVSVLSPMAAEEGPAEVAEPPEDGAIGVVTEIGEELMRSYPKSVQKSTLRSTLLSTTEREQLTRMIFDTHYAGKDKNKDDEAMWYQSALEVHWLEEWALESLGDQKRDDARRSVKKAVLQRVDLHKPLAYIIGSQPFYGCNIKCSPPLLCPRPETEMWTHWFVRTYLSSITEECASLRVLDLCCGTGCIGIAVAKHVPFVQVVAVDIAEEAVRASEHNARHNGIPSSRFRVVKSDMFEAFCAPEGTTSSLTQYDTKSTRRPLAPEHVGSFDVVLCNPPYVLPEQYVDLPPSVKLWESKLALVGDEKRELQHHLYFQELCEYGSAILKPKSQRNSALHNAPNIIIEVGLQAEIVASLMERSKLWENVEVHLDFAQQMRWISASSSH
uniref:peptide chain release factor N(5)-glutamine methyltransferase n=1 Tax=Trypanosoma congolense (strain IL3000) TaxID=1068625 RepID=G0UXF8_TRYCI|nr:unnamed protein product [Trypanosoma congolense IL3000]